MIRWFSLKYSICAAVLASLAGPTLANTFQVTASSATPTAVTAGQTVSLSAAVEATIDAPHMNVGLELFNAAGTKVETIFYQNQNFLAGQVSQYNWDLVVPTDFAAGTYTLKVAVLDSGWSTLFWDNSATNFVLSAASTGTAPTGPTAVPGMPTDLSATAGDAQVSLQWKAVGGATSYRVKRATTSGGPYAQVSVPTAAAYSDASLTNGTTYYYVVSAVDSLGEGGNSAQVTAQPAAPVASPPTSVGTWVDVTPAGVNLTDLMDCGNYGTESLQADTGNPGTLYTEFNCQGIWKSTDYGATWQGPINTGTNGATVTDCAGGITVSSSGANAPTIYQSCIRGNAFGFWKSTDGGVNWTKYFVAPSGASRQDYYAPVIDPYNPSHLLMAGHEQDFLVESFDAGETWTSVPLAAGMLENGGTGAIFFINTGDASTTSNTWLWMAQQSGGIYGTWRTSNGGADWAQVDKNEHPHGASQIYQPDTNGVVYMAGAYSAKGWGVLRSTDYGQTWSHVGGTGNETGVFGTSQNVYAMFGFPVGPGGASDPSFEVASETGTGDWDAPGTPAGLTQGFAQVSVINDGTHNILVGGMWNSGIWRYIEPQE